jgi:hypothetical protein
MPKKEEAESTKTGHLSGKTVDVKERNRKKWKQNTDRWAKWKAEQKEKKEVKEEANTQSSPGIEEEEHPKLPESYGGEYTVRKIYMEKD